jgi:hypothetical protein
MTEQEFKEACSKVDIKAVSDEVFAWLLANTEDYVDNSDTAYMLYFSGKVLDELPAIGSFYKIYELIPRGIEEDLEARIEADPESQKIEESCIEEYEKVVQAVTETIKGDKENLEKLFEKLIYYYDTKIITDGVNIVPFTEKLDGYIEMEGLIFEPFPIELEVKKKDVTVDKFGREKGNGKVTVVKKITIEPGFCIQFELVYWRPVKDSSSYSMM